MAFPQYLKECRLNAGFNSLAEAIDAASRQKRKGPGLSRAKLSHYECGRIETLKPEILRLLATLYGVPYVELATRWFNDRYEIGAEEIQSSRLYSSHPLHVETSDPQRKLRLLSLELFKERQSLLASGTRVLVSAPHFLDDSIFYDMVLKNLTKGVIYYYILPESQRVTYRNLVKRLQEEMSKRGQQSKRDVMFFVPRSDHDTPVNQVLYLHPSGQVDGFIGLLGEMFPLCYQEVSPALAMRLFHSFLWMIRVGLNQKFAEHLSSIEIFWATQARENTETPIQLVEKAHRGL